MNKDDIIDEEDAPENLPQLVGKTITELDAWQKEHPKIDMLDETDAGKTLFEAYLHAHDAYESRKEEESDEVRKRMDRVRSEVKGIEDRNLFSMMIVDDLSFYGDELNELINKGLPAHLQAHTGTTDFDYFEGLFKWSGVDYNADVLEKLEKFKSGNPLTSEESVSLESAIICAYGRMLERVAQRVVNYKVDYPKLHDTPMIINQRTLKSREITDEGVEP